MKKAVIILVLTALAIFGSAAFAQGLDIKQGTEVNARQYGSLAYSRTQMLDFMNKVLQKKQSIAQNRAKIKDLNNQLNIRIKQTKTRIKELRENPTSLDTGKISSIRNTVSEMASAKKNLVTTVGLLKKKEPELIQARLQRKPDAFLKTLDDIIVIQQTRIESMQKMINDLDQLDKALE